MKKVFYIILLIVAIILGAIFVTKMSNKENSNNNIEKSMTNHLIEDEVEFIVLNNEIVNTENPENTISEETIENIIAEQQGEQIDYEEKAIEIAKEDWGEDDTVYFSSDGKNSDGKYVIYVRSRNTTNAIYKYIVDAKKGTFTSEIEAH